jgi:hypothetical protein
MKDKNKEQKAKDLVAAHVANEKAKVALDAARADILGDLANDEIIEEGGYVIKRVAVKSTILDPGALQKLGIDLNDVTIRNLSRIDPELVVEQGQKLGVTYYKTEPKVVVKQSK